MVNFRLLLLPCLLCIASQNVHAYLKTELSQTKIKWGEEITLTITTDEDIRKNTLSILKPLEPIFKITQTQDHSYSRSYSNINDVVSESETQIWRYSLVPKKAGTLTIPAIKFGNSSSKALKLTVLKPNSTSTPKNESFILLGSVDNSHQHYVQSDIVYTLKLLYLKRIISGSITSLSDVMRTPKVLTKTVAQNKRSQMKYRGQNYSVLEWRYTLNPQRSGKLKIPSLSFSGRVLMKNNQASRISLSTEPLELDILPQPITWPKNYDWLPAKDLTIGEKWRPSVADWTVGEKISRNIQIIAHGVPSNAIPELDINHMSPLISVYPQKINRNDKLTDKGHTANYEINIDYVPTQTGLLTLPEIRLPWWDLKHDKLRYAVLTERQIPIRNSGATNFSEQVFDSTPHQNTANLLAPSATPISNIASTSETSVLSDSENFLWAITPDNLWIFIVGWLASNGLLLFIGRVVVKYFSRTKTTESKGTETNNLERALSELERIIKNTKTPDQISQLYPKCLHLYRTSRNHFSQALEQEWQKQMSRMGAEIYGENKQFNPETLLSQLSLLITKSKEKSLSKSALPKLYPNP